METKTVDSATKKYVNFVKNNFFFRVSGSKYGAGLFAVRDIPKGTRMIAGYPPKTRIPFKGKNGSNGKSEYNGVKGKTFSVSQLKKLGLTMRQISLMQDFVCRGKKRNNVPIPEITSMMFPPPYQFSNHSENPNVDVQGYHLVALRKIKNGEELVHDYRITCNDPNEIIY
jgi:hypothetical protein